MSEEKTCISSNVPLKGSTFVQRGSHLALIINYLNLIIDFNIDKKRLQNYILKTLFLFQLFLFT